MAEGMKDLGNLSRKAVALRNRLSTHVVYRDAMDREAWENQLRFASNHQDEIDILFSLDDLEAENFKDEVEPEPEPEGLVTAMSPKTAQDYRQMNYKQLVKIAKQKGISDFGNTKEQVIEALMASVEA